MLPPDGKFRAGPVQPAFHGALRALQYCRALGMTAAFDAGEHEHFTVFSRESLEAFFQQLQLIRPIGADVRMHGR